MRGYAGPRTPITMEATDLRWKHYAEKAGHEALEGAALHLVGRVGNLLAGWQPAILVVNPLNWSRQGTVQAWARMPSGTRQLVAFDGEQETAAVILDRRGEEALVAFHARVSSLGFRAYAIRPGKRKAGSAFRRIWRTAICAWNSIRKLAASCVCSTSCETRSCCARRGIAHRVRVPANRHQKARAGVKLSADRARPSECKGSWRSLRTRWC